MIASRSTRTAGAKRATALLPALLAPGLWLSAMPLPGLRAQEPLVREITFVRALAKDMKFIELAKVETDRLAGEYRGASDQDKIAQLAVEVAYYGARSRSDRTQQRALFKETVEKSQELIDRSSDAAVKLEAMSTLANASQDFGQFLIEELEIAREENPESVPGLIEETGKVLRAGIEACGNVKAALQAERSKPEKEIEYYLMWMKQAVLMREQARADKENRAVLIERSISELTDMVLESGEETAIGLRGLFEIAQCYEVGGDVKEAIGSYKDTVEQITTSLKQNEEGEIELSGEMQGFLFDMLQEVYVRAGETMAREGDAGTAKLFEEFHAAMKTFGEQGIEEFEVVSPSYGHLMLLAECRFQAESGDAQKVQAALAMAQRINEKHPADFVGQRAKAVLRDILELQKGLVSGALLVEVGKGELQNKNYEGAVKGLRQAIGAMTEKEQQDLGLEAYEMLGRSYALSDRFLEAILALSEGLQRFGKAEQDASASPAMKELSSDTADRLDRAMALHKRATKEDAFFQPLWAEMAELVARFSSGGANKLAWKEGNGKLQDGKYDEAAVEYAKITKDYLFYEQAQVRRAQALSAAGKLQEALDAVQAYRAYTESEAGDLGRDAGKQQVRKVALADAAFCEMQIAYHRARGNADFKLDRNLENYPGAIELTQSFLSNFAKEADHYAGLAMAYLGRLHCDVGQLDRAEEVYVQLKQKDGLRASHLATEIFVEYESKVKMLAKELDETIKQGSEQQIAAARSELTGMRQKLAAIGVEYVQSSPRPQLAILIKTMQNFERLGEWARVDEVAKKTLSIYGTDQDAGVRSTIDKLVRPMVGEALLQQRRFQEAFDMLSAAEQATPEDFDLKRQVARALGGWFEYNQTTATAQRVPGLDRPEDAYAKYYGDPKDSYRVYAEAKFQKFSLEWYRFMWEAYWFAKQAGNKDTKFKETAGKFFRIARSTDDFATLKNYGEEGLKLWSYFQANR